MLVEQQLVRLHSNRQEAKISKLYCLLFYAIYVIGIYDVFLKKYEKNISSSVTVQEK